MASSKDPERSLADNLLDEFVPRELDWQGWVTAYPKTSVTIAAVAGFWLGKTRGRSILTGVSTLAAETVNESINEFFGRDVV